jgi:uncharacterized SAM-binding protein YcdF (DUF218 family)
LLLVASLPATSEVLLGVLENRFPHLEPAEAPPADAIVVLSGMLRDTPSVWTRPEFAEAADRFESGLALWRAGRAKTLVFTRGQMPWARDRLPEGEQLARLARERGVPAEGIVLTGVVGDTAGEAAEVARLAQEHGWTRVLLVTSAFHQPRAMRLFQRVGAECVAFPCDHRAAGRLTPVKFLPTAGGLKETEVALREFYGILFAQFRELFRRDQLPESGRA